MVLNKFCLQPLLFDFNISTSEGSNEAKNVSKFEDLLIYWIQRAIFLINNSFDNSLLLTYNSQ